MSMEMKYIDWEKNIMTSFQNIMSRGNKLMISKIGLLINKKDTFRGNRNIEKLLKT